MQGTHGSAGTSGQGAGDGGFLGAGPYRAAGAGLGPCSGVSCCLSKDTGPKVCGEQMAAATGGPQGPLLEQAMARRHRPEQ